MSICTLSWSSETSKGSEVKIPQPRNARASCPATPASKAATPAGPASLYLRANRVGSVRARRLEAAWPGVWAERARELLLRRQRHVEQHLRKRET